MEINSIKMKNGGREERQPLYKQVYLDFSDFVGLELRGAVVMDEADATR